MEDCCLPTCSMAANVDCVECASGYDAIYACDAAGDVLVDDGDGYSQLQLGPPSTYYKSWASCNACSPPEDASKSTCSASTFNTFNYCPSSEETFTCSDLSDTGDTVIAHMCPRLMLGSSVMTDAADADGLGDTHLYAVVGHDTNSDIPVDASLTVAMGCGQCYELEFEDDRPSIIAQNFNTAAPSGDNDFNFDLYMAAGGYGAFNSCFKDPNAKPNQTAYDTKVYTQYPSDTYADKFPAKEINDGAMQDTYISTEDMWGNGGIRGSAAMNDVDAALAMTNAGSGGPYIVDSDVCDNLKGVSDTVTQFAQESCRAAFNTGVHFNAPSDKGGLTRVRRVRCPKNLQYATGLYRDDASLPNVANDADADKGWFEGCREDCGLTLQQSMRQRRRNR